MGNVVFNPKTPSILVWSKRFELWFCYGVLFNIAAFAWYWFQGDRIDDPNLRLGVCAFVGGEYLLLAILSWRIWDANGNRQYDSPIARLWWRFAGLFEWY